MIRSARQRRQDGARGGGGEAMGVSLVSTIPLPATTVADAECAGERIEGTDQSQPKPKAMKEPDAIPIPDKDAKIKAKPVTTASKQKPPSAA